MQFISRLSTHHRQKKNYFPLPHEEFSRTHTYSSETSLLAMNLNLKKSLLFIPAFPILQGRKYHPCWWYLAAIAASMPKPFQNRFYHIYKQMIKYIQVTTTGDLSLLEKSPPIFTLLPTCLGPGYEETWHHLPPSVPSTTSRGRDKKGQDSTFTSQKTRMALRSALTEPLGREQPVNSWCGSCSQPNGVQIRSTLPSQTSVLHVVIYKNAQQLRHTKQAQDMAFGASEVSQRERMVIKPTTCTRQYILHSHPQRPLSFLNSHDGKLSGHPESVCLNPSQQEEV